MNDPNTSTPLIDSAADISHWLGTVIVLPVMTVIVTLDVGLRYMFNSPLVWSQEMTGICLLLLCFLSQGKCWETNHHIRMDAAYNAFAPRGKAFANVLTALAGGLFFAAIGYQALLDVPYMIRTNEVSDELRWPLWPYTAVMVICCVILVAQMAFHLVRSARKLVKGGA